MAIIYTTIICARCHAEATKELRYVTQAKKRGMIQYCSKKCAAFGRAASLKARGHKPNTEAIRDYWKTHIHPSRGKGTGDPFAYYIRKNRQRNTGNITSTYLADLWKKQEGKCAWTGIPIKLRPPNIKKDNIFTMASLDRIDSSKPYDQGNVQFVVAALNFAKSDKSDAEFREFLERLRSS